MNLFFGHRATISQDLEIWPNVVVSRTFIDHYEIKEKSQAYEGETPKVPK